MRLFILGSTGGSGRALVTQAKARGHEVTTFGRSDENAIHGNPMDANALAAAMRGHDAVLSAIGARTLIAHRLRTESARAVVEAMKRSGVRRLIIMSSTMTDEHPGWKTWFFSRTLIRSHANDQRAMEAVVRASDVDWTIVRPPTLTDGPLTNSGTLLDHEPGQARLSRADTAKLMLDVVESGVYKRQVVWMR
ncbi:MAG TPA: NAD(P)-binding oxidoreductase [Thermoanaerobaculia bacterium]